MKGRQGSLGHLGLLSLAAGLLLCSPVVSFGQARNRPAAGLLSKDQQICAQLTKAWTSFYNGKIDDAVKQAAGLTKLAGRQYQSVVVEASHIQARGWWAHGSRTNQARARRMWKQLKGRSTLNSMLTRLKIAQALELELQAASQKKPDKREEAIGILEEILKDRQLSLATPEAGIDLARLQVSARRFDDADKTLKSVIKLLGDKDNLTRMELPDASMAAPYIAAARVALKRLKYQRNAGREQFEAAEKLRNQKKWTPAYQAYQTVAKAFADTDYAPRSELAMGHCFIGLKQVDKALVHWGKFTKAQPAGPWRAQAYVATIDIYLEDQLDLPQAEKCATAARNALPAALGNKKAVESWKPLVFDLHLRVGLVAFCQGQGAIAAKAFGAAKKLTRDKAIRESLDVLATAAKTGSPIIPQDVAGRKTGKKSLSASATPADRAALALSLGMIYHITRRHDHADAFFTRVVGAPASKGKRAVRPMRGATTPQLAFAIFGKGAVLQARNKIPAAKEHFITSIKTFREGAWHDESLYRIARIIQKQADAKIAKANSDARKRLADPTKPPTRVATEIAAKLATKIKTQAREEVHIYWQELIDRYPKSPRCEQAIYSDGVFLCEMAQAAPAAQSTKMWKDAMFMLARFCELYPKSPWAGDAYVRQMDVALERMFDLELTKTTSQQVVTWAKWLTDNKSDLQEAPTLPAWCLVEMYPSYASLKPALYECYLRAGLVAYLSRDVAASQRLFSKAAANAPPPNEVVVHGKVVSGVKRLIAVAQHNQRLTPKEVLNGDGRAQLMLQLADLYFCAEDFEHSIDLLDRVIAKKGRIVTPTQRSWAHLIKGRCLHGQFEPLKAREEYIRCADADLKAPWSPKALFYAANVIYNYGRKREQAAVEWRKIAKRYPGSSEAEKAEYYIAWSCQMDGMRDEATKAYHAFLKKYPNSGYARPIQVYHLPDLAKMKQSPDKNSDKKPNKKEE